MLNHGEPGLTRLTAAFTRLYLVSPRVKGYAAADAAAHGEFSDDIPALIEQRNKLLLTDDSCLVRRAWRKRTGRKKGGCYRSLT